MRARWFGLFLLTVLQLALFFSGSTGRSVASYVSTFGPLLIIALAVRLAVTGNLSRVERTAASAAAGISAAALLAVCIVAGLALLVMLFLFQLFGTLGHAGEAFGYFGSTALTVGAIFIVTALAARVLIYSGYRMWTPRPTARWLTIGTFFAVYVAILILPRFFMS